MVATVLSGISGAFYYRPAGTRAVFNPSDVTIAGAIFNVGQYLGFRVGDPVKFSVANQLGGTPSGTLPSGIVAGTTYYVISYNRVTGSLTVSATLGGSVIAITTQGSVFGPNRFQVAYADFEVVGQVRSWTFNINRAEIDVSTIGQAPGQRVPFKSYISGFADGNGTATLYLTDDDHALSNRIIEDVLQHRQVGCGMRLYSNRVMSNGATVNNLKSRSITLDAILTSASMGADPDNAQTVEISFRPSSSPTLATGEDSGAGGGGGGEQTVLRYDIYEQNGNTVVKASGAFDFSGIYSVLQNDAAVTQDGFVNVAATSASDASSYIYAATGGQTATLRSFPLTATPFPVVGATCSMPSGLQGSSSTGIPTFLVASPDADPQYSFFALGLDPDYNSGDPILSTSTFSGDFADNFITPPSGTLPILIGAFELVGGGSAVEVYFSPAPQ